MFVYAVPLVTRHVFLIEPMPPKRDAGAPGTSPPMKMIKIGTDGQEYGCDPEESRYRLAEDGAYSPFMNNEVRVITVQVY